MALTLSNKFPTSRTCLKTINKTIAKVGANASHDITFMENEILDDLVHYLVRPAFTFAVNLSDVACGALDVEGTNLAVNPRLVCLAL